MNKKNFIIISLSILIVSLVVLISFLLISKDSNKQDLQSNKDKDVVYKNDFEKNENSEQTLAWRLGANGYEKTGETPECDSPFILDLPVNKDHVTSILYPGQTRGGNYKAHGGFRFDENKTNEEDVFAPIDGYIVNGVRYIVEGEIQYAFDVINPCGIMFRMGHLRELTPRFQEIADKFPEPTADSRSTEIIPNIKIEKGEKIATKIGIIGTSNTFMDFGVYDLRNKNLASKNPEYFTKSQNNTLALYAICWLNNLGENETYIKSLPAGDPESGKSSDYCN